MKRSILSILIGSLAFVATSAFGGSVIRVDHRAGGSDPDGVSWSTAYAHPQDAIDAAKPGDEIWVAEGRYGPAGREAVVEFAAGVRLFGGFAGDETRREDRDPSERRTVLDGRRAVFHVVVAASASTLDGFVITGGRAGGAADAARGGGVLASGVSDFEVEDCTFLGNAARYGGGIAFVSTIGCALRNCKFESNAASDGGAVHIEDASPVIDGCDFKSNHAADGGAMYCARGSPAIVDCRFIGNVARYDGGAVFLDEGSRPDVRRSDFRVNSGDYGGAVYAWGAGGEFADCVFSANRASSEGGAVRLSASTRSLGAGGVESVLTDCVLKGNRAMFGGGVSTSGRARVKLERCTFRGNEADFGGGSVHGTTPVAKGCTFAENRVFGEIEDEPVMDVQVVAAVPSPAPPGPGLGEMFITAAPGPRARR